MNFTFINKDRVLELASQLSALQAHFLDRYEVDDVYGNSKIFEIITADKLGHDLIPGHSGSRDARDKNGNEIEYKHFKETSSNHSWTFNDFSDTTINKLNDIKAVLFTHINDTGGIYEFDWYYDVEGKIIANYLTEATSSINNTRKMINVSPNQIEKKLGIFKTYVINQNINGVYTQDLNRIFGVIQDLEKETGVDNILTSNKIWEVLTAIHLNHNVNSEQGGRAGAHDAYDEFGNQYEYKISKSNSWNFQDISENVLKKYESLENFILAIKDVHSTSIKKIYVVDIELLDRIKEKLEEKAIRFAEKGKLVRRLQISITLNDAKPYLLEELTF